MDQQIHLTSKTTTITQFVRNSNGQLHEEIHQSEERYILLYLTGTFVLLFTSKYFEHSLY